MAWYKSSYRINETISYVIPDHVIEDCVLRAGTSKISAIKNLRDASRSEGPFGREIVISLRDAKEVIEDYMERRP